MTKNIFLKPFLKRAWGKRYLLPMINKYRPKKYNSYIEPFLWWGAVLFDLQPKVAFVNDINHELINLYQIIKDDVNWLIKELIKLSDKNNADDFYKIRWLDREPSKFNKLTDVEKAARIIYLNKTCFNWLFRVNSQWQFNSPFWKYKNPNIVNEEVLRAVSKYLNENSITFSCGSFSDMIQYINKWDFVYFDPPYDPVSDTSSFTWYTLDWFGKEDQIKLRDFCVQVDKIWAKFLLSNSATKFIREIYSEWDFKEIHIETVSVPRTINANANWRWEVDEFLVHNYKLNGRK